MQRRLITVILFAFVSALAASTVLYKLINSASSRPSPLPKVSVVVAARDLPAGAFVLESDISQMDWPGAVSPQWAKRREDVVGRGLVAAVNKSEPFPESRLADKGAGSGIASRIPPGMRVVAVHLDELSGLSKIILPGMHVDVLSTGALPGRSSQEQVTRTILQNVQVVSTDQSIEHAEKEKAAAVQSANLLVTPRQAEILSQAVAQARVQLAIRNPLDGSDKGSTAESASAERPAVKIRRVAKAVPAPAPVLATPVAAPKLEHPTVEVVHGTKRAITEVGASAKQETSHE